MIHASAFDALPADSFVANDVRSAKRIQGDGPNPGAVAIVHEHPGWAAAFRTTLERHGMRCHEVDAAALLATSCRSPEAAARQLADVLARHRVVVNRISPSAASRGHERAIPFARTLLPELERRGVRVINGARAFEVEISKRVQLDLARRLGVPIPWTHVIDPADDIELEAERCVRRWTTRRASAFGRPIAADAGLIIKPDRGGSGIGITDLEPDAITPEAVVAAVRAAGDAAGGGAVLVQERLRAIGGTVDRLEFVGGTLVTAMRVRARNTFNLCPDSGCVRDPARPGGGPASVTFEPWTDVPPSVVALGRRVIEAAEIDIGGIELIERPSGRFAVIDVNSTSVHRADVAAAFGVDPGATITTFLKQCGDDAGEAPRSTTPRPAGAIAPPALETHHTAWSLTS